MKLNMDMNDVLIKCLRVVGVLFFIGGIIVGFLMVSAADTAAGRWGLSSAEAFIIFIIPFALGFITALFQLWMAQHLENQVDALSRQRADGLAHKLDRISTEISSIKDEVVKLQKTQPQDNSE